MRRKGGGMRGHWRGKDKDGGSHRGGGLKGELEGGEQQGREGGEEEREGGITEVDVEGEGGIEDLVSGIVGGEGGEEKGEEWQGRVIGEGGVEVEKATMEREGLCGQDWRKMMRRKFEEEQEGEGWVINEKG